ERPLPAGWRGFQVSLVGVGLFLYPATFSASRLVGLVAALVGWLANAAAAVLGRVVNRDEGLPGVAVRLVSMGVGGAALFATGVAVQGLPQLSLRSWLIVTWLAGVNTALAFTLWNATLQKLSALESSVINNTMLIQIAVLAWLFLGESLGPRQVAGIVLA